MRGAGPRGEGAGGVNRDKLIALEHRPKGKKRWIFLGAWPTWKSAQFEGIAHGGGNCDCSLRLIKFVRPAAGGKEKN